LDEWAESREEDKENEEDGREPQREGA